MRLGLRSKILVIAFLVVTGTVLAIAVSSSYFFTQQSAKAYTSRSLAIAKGLAIQLERILALGIDPVDLQGFEAQCAEAVERYSGLSYAMVLGRDGRMLFHSKHEQIGRQAEAGVLAAARAHQRSVSVDGAQRIHAVIEPVRAINGGDVAYVVVGFPQSVIDHERNQLLLLTVGVGVSALMVGLVVLFAALSYTVVRPISSFVQHIGRIRAGERYDIARAISARDDELGIMVNGFDALLDRISERERDLVAAKEAAEAASKAKSQFLAVMSHELRTPLSAVLGMNELLLRTTLDDRQQRFAGNVKCSGKALLRLINDILDFSRIEAGELSVRREPFVLRDLIEQTIEPFIEPARAKGLDLSLSVDPTLPEQVVGDPARVGQILDNLVSNAVKFTEQGRVRVSVSPSRACIRFSVSDTGIGIPADFIDHVYESFRQADGSQTRRYGGTGLGLAIVKQLADALHGRVEVRSRPGQGSTFWVELPLPDAEDSEAFVSTQRTAVPADEEEVSGATSSVGEQTGNEVSAEKRQILLAEDNEAHQELVALYLSDTPYELAVVGTGALALELLAHGRFHAVLMDWQLPDLDGLQATRTIREREQRSGGRRTPIIALTAHAFRTDRAACLAAGMDDYLSKPFTRASLLRVLERWTQG